MVNRQQSETSKQMVAKNEEQQPQVHSKCPSRVLVAGSPRMLTVQPPQRPPRKGVRLKQPRIKRPRLRLEPRVLTPTGVDQSRFQAEEEKRAESARRDVARQAAAPPAPAPAVASTSVSNERELAKRNVEPERSRSLLMKSGKSKKRRGS